MASFFFKFKFKWWSWELDAVKLVPVFIFVLACLPVLPYEKKDGKLVSVLGVEASVNNFYFVGWRFFDEPIDDGKAMDSIEEKNDDFEGGSLDELGRLLEEPIPDVPKHQEYLISRGASKERAKCISL